MRACSGDPADSTHRGRPTARKGCSRATLVARASSPTRRDGTSWRRLRDAVCVTTPDHWHAAIALAEKQKIKHYYGLGERQLRRYFDAVGRKSGNTGELLLLMCERRLDNVVRRVGFTKTRPQARQGVAHGHFRVNGLKVDKPSYILRPGDVVEVRGRENLRNLYRGVIANTSPIATAVGETVNATRPRKAAPSPPAALISAALSTPAA